MLRIKKEYKDKLVSDPNTGNVLVVNDIPENTHDYYSVNGLGHLFESIKIKKVKFKATKKDDNLEDESN